MTTHIESVLTEVTPVPEQDESGEADDNRWNEQQKIEAMMARQVRIYRRTFAEGMND